MTLGPLVDTHAHLDMPAFAGDVPDVLRRAALANVRHVIIPGVHPDTFAGLQALVETPGPVTLHAAWGLHPQWVPDVPESLQAGVLDAVEAMHARVPALAVGECGLDYRMERGRETAGRQRVVLERHLELAQRLGKPLLLHCLGAHEDLLAMLRGAGAFPGGLVMHSYSGSAEQLGPFAKLGAYISFAGPVAWENARKAPKAAAACPAHLLLSETDAPDQSPVPFRGQRNEPAHVVEVVRALARCRNEDAPETARLCRENAARLFGFAGTASDA